MNDKRYNFGSKLNEVRREARQDKRHYFRYGLSMSVQYAKQQQPKSDTGALRNGHVQISHNGHYVLDEEI